MDEIVRVFEEGRDLLTDHVLEQMLERDINVSDLRSAITADDPEIIEDYPDDDPLPSCLIICTGAGGTTYHVVCSRPPDVWVITAYEPDTIRWSPDRRRRLL